MAAPGRKGNRPGRLFPRLLRRLLRPFMEPFAGVIGANESRPTKSEASALQQRLDLVIELLERGFAHDRLAIDEKGRGSLNLQ
jgi:hypothetical protein